MNADRKISGEYQKFVFARRIIGPIITGALAILGLTLMAGCATGSGKLSDQDVQAIQAGQKSVVLLRVTMGARHDPSVRKKIHFDTITVNLDRQSHNLTVLIIDWKAPSIAAGKQGWRYGVFDSGSYYLMVRAGNPWVGTPLSEPYYFYVPPGKQVVYAGSFEFDPIGEQQPLGFTDYVLQWSGINIEIDEARSVAGESPVLAQFRDITASLPVAYDDPALAAGDFANRWISRVEPHRGAALTSEDVGTHAARTVGRPLGAAAKGFFSDANDGQETAESLEDEKEVGVAGLAGVAVLVGSVPIVLAVDKTFGAAARKKWAPYEAGLKQEWEQFDFEGRLAGEMSNRLLSNQSTVESTNAPVAGTGPVVLVQPYRALLRETRYRKFTLEIAILVKLVDPESNTVLWAHDYVYSDYETGKDDPGFLAKSCETLMPAQSPWCLLADYEKPSGVALFHQQLADAVMAIGTDLATRFQDAGFRQ